MTWPGRPPVEAVRGIDLEVHQGECFGVLGPNGAGKTTTIEILEGIVQCTSGQVEVLGRRWTTEGDEIRKRIGISLQETRLSEKLRVLETLTFFRSCYPSGLEPRDILELVGLEPKETAMVRTLSGGQKQRLAVACALVGDPELLFLDEPTTGLDPRSRRDLWDIIREYGNRGRTVLITTHYMDEAEKLCDRVAIVDQGRIIALGTPRELIASLGGEHVIEYTVDQGHIQAGQEDQLSAMPGVRSVSIENEVVALTVAEVHATVPAIIQSVQQAGCALTSLTTRHASLEDVFVRLTGRHLDDADSEDSSQ